MPALTRLSKRSKGKKSIKGPLFWTGLYLFRSILSLPLVSSSSIRVGAHWLLSWEGNSAKPPEMEYQVLLLSTSGRYRERPMRSVTVRPSKIQFVRTSDEPPKGEPRLYRSG